MNLADLFRRACAEAGIPLSDACLTGAMRYLELLRKWNRRISLTSIEEDRELVRFHFVEAFWCAARFLEAGPIADIGTGAGFPGLAAKLYRPDLKITLLERNFKKCVFLERACRELSLDVRIVHGPAEAWPGWPETHVATLRALQPEPLILSALERHRVRLLQFRGPQSTVPSGWRLLREERFPLSERRTVAEYGPASGGDHS